MKPGWPGVMLVVFLGLAPLVAGADEATAPPQPYRYDAGGKRDPFVALVRDGRLTAAAAQGARTGGGRPVLTGILWDPAGGSLALINDEELKMGDRIEGYQVVEIQPDAVVLSDGGAPLVLRITFDQPPKTPAKKTQVEGGEGS